MSALLVTGLAHHQAGRLAEAERCYRQILTARPDHADALHLLGLLAARVGRFDAAIELIAHAIEQVPGNATYHYNLGNVSRDAGRLEDAVARFEAAIRVDPLHVEAFVNLSVVLMELNRPADSVTTSDRALAIKPDHAAVHYNRGNAYRNLGRWDDALRDYDTAIRITPDFAEALANRGITLGDLGRWDEAVVSHERAIALRPENAGFHYNLGIAQRATGHPAHAIGNYDRCLARDPGHAQAMANRGNALADLGRIEEALKDLDAALARRPDDPEILYNRGVTLEKAYAYEAALTDYQHALSLRPRFPECAHNASMTLLLLGRFQQAWPLHEWRFHVRDFPGRHRGFTQPRWIGDNLNGRALLIQAEQGFGDAIQFCRYAAAIKGGKVIMEVPPALARLFTSLPGVDQLVMDSDQLPPFDVYCPMLSLPATFGTRADTIPPPARLKIPEPASLPPETDGPRIGIVWSGNPVHTNDRHRSMRLRTMLPLIPESGRIYALQTYMNDADRETLTAHPEIVDLGSGFRDFSDTAAAIMALDLVISVDTSVAHLTATLGVPTWVLLPFRPEWRWQLNREDSPWYPAARLFRQSAAGDWDGVIAQVRVALRSLFPTSAS